MMSRLVKFAALAVLAAAGLFVCNLGWIRETGRLQYDNGDFAAHLAGEYELWRLSSAHVIIGRRDNPNYPHGTGVDEVVPTEVVTVSVQGNFITASQCIYSYEQSPGRIPDESDFRYWIINVREEQVQGPLTKEEFEAACRSLRVDSRKMEAVEFYRERAEKDRKTRGN